MIAEIIQLPSPFLKCVNGFDKIAFINISDVPSENFCNPVFSIAFNFFVKGKFGKEEYQLELK